MRIRLFALTMVAALFGFSGKAHAYEKWLGTLTSTGTSVNNTTTAVPFALPSGSAIRFAVQCDSAVYVRAGVGSVTVAATGATKGPQLQAQQLFDIPIDSQQFAIAIISVSGTSNCDVYQVLP